MLDQVSIHSFESYICATPDQCPLYVPFTPVETNQWMVGSYGPKTEPAVYTTPEEDTPSGVMSRGHYTVKSQFIDDDKHSYLDWEWAFDIKKDWAE